LESTLVQILLSVLFGAIAGGTTNAIAVWMLFHPYEPPSFFRWRIRLLQGAIPKNKARLAAAIGRTVGTKLLTSEDLARTLAEPTFRETFDSKLAEFLRSVFDERRGSIASMLPESAVRELRAVLVDTGTHLVARLDGWLAGDEFHERARSWAASLADQVRNESVASLLTPEREAALTEAADNWIAEAVGGGGFENAVRDYLDRGAVRLLEPGRTFQELVPMGLVAALERAIAGYLPIALERLGGLLNDPAARNRVERVLHEVLDRFMKDLKFHQRLVAALVITPETVDRVLRAVEAEGASKISELLQDSDVRDAMARGVNNAIVEFLEKEVVAVLGSPDDAPVQEAKATMAGWALSLARDPQTRSFLVEKLRATLTSTERRTWGDLFRHLPPERVADAIVSMARSDRARSLYREAATRSIDLVLEREIGRIADHLPDNAPERIEKAIAEPLWHWIQDQVPAVAQRVDIAKKVEQKILDFPIQQVEAIIKGVTERELLLIVRLGYLLGGIIGLVSAGIAVALR
jgi:uncharacterized membrane protein YheB (UPF0754 family)